MALEQHLAPVPVGLGVALPTWLVRALAHPPLGRAVRARQLPQPRFPARAPAAPDAARRPSLRLRIGVRGSPRPPVFDLAPGLCYKFGQRMGSERHSLRFFGFGFGCRYAWRFI